MVGGGAPSSSLAGARSWVLSWAVGEGSLALPGLCPILLLPPAGQVLHQPEVDIASGLSEQEGLSRLDHGN